MADLINLTALAAPTSILPSTGTTGVILSVFNLASVDIGTKILSGVLTSNTYKEIVSLSVPGWIRWCAVYTNDATSRTIGLKIVIDGTDVLDEVSATISTSGVGIFGVGHGFVSSGNQAVAALEKFNFNSSLSISIKSSISETDKLTLIYLTAV